MVSGLVTSPCDQLRIFSGDARLILMASKSAIVFCISNGLERNKVFLRFLLSGQLPAISRQLPVFYVSRWLRALALRNVISKVFCGAGRSQCLTGHRSPAIDHYS